MNTTRPDRSRTFYFATRLMALVFLAIFASGARAQTQAETQALAEISTSMNNLKSAINARTAAGSLDYTHLLPFFDSGFRHDGANATEVSADFAQGMRSGSISTGTVNTLVSLTTDANGNSKASTTGSVSGSNPEEGSFTQTWNPTSQDGSDLAWYYKPAGGTWKLYGNQSPGRFRVQTFIENRQSGNSCQGCDGTFLFTWFDAEVPLGQISSISVTGPGFNATPLVIADVRTQEKQASPAPAPKLRFSRQTFRFNGPAVSSLPAPGSVYTFNVTPTSGTPYQVTRTVPQTTTQTIAITSPTGHALSDAKLGGALTVNWTLPTFPVQSIDLNMTTNSAAGMCNGPQPNSHLAANATSYTFSPVPTQCLGQPVADNVSQGYPVQVVVNVFGTSGEYTRAWYSFGTGSCNGTNLAPGNLSATSVGANLVQLQWIRACMPTTIANYSVWRSSPGGTFVLIGTTDQNTRSFSDSTASSGVTYTYYVIANDSSGNKSGQSNQVTVTTPTGGNTVTTTTSTTTTTGTTTTTTLASSGANTMNLASGWNLLGNGVSTTLNVATVFGDKGKVSTVWKWVAAKLNWAFYAPSLSDGGQAYAASKGYDFLSVINAGEGFWVNAVGPFTAPLPTGTTVPSTTFKTLASGWSLLAIGDSKTPSQFNIAIDNSITPPSPGATPPNLTTLWAWDASQLNWYFYAPSLDATALANYIASKQYLGFGTRTLSPATGFWVNK